MKRINEEEFKLYEERTRAKLINSLSGFKSANLIATKSNSGQTNVAIFSSLFHLGASPALIGFIIRPDVSPRDTLLNLRENGFFTVNHINEAICKEAHQTSARYPHEMSEFEACGLTPEYLDGFDSPFVKESHIKFSAQMIREEKIPENNTHLIIASIKSIYLPCDSLDEDGSINIAKAGTIALSGLDTYFNCTPIGKLSYAKIDKELKWL